MLCQKGHGRRGVNEHGNRACQEGGSGLRRVCAHCSVSSAGMCLEKRAFYRLVSGMHASINTHLSAIYLMCGRLVNRSGQTVAVI